MEVICGYFHQILPPPDNAHHQIACISLTHLHFIYLVELSLNKIILISYEDLELEQF